MFKPTRKKIELKLRIKKLTDKVMRCAHDINRFAGKYSTNNRHAGLYRHRRNMAFLSIVATRKKLIKLNEELRVL